MSKKQFNVRSRFDLGAAAKRVAQKVGIRAAERLVALVTPGTTLHVRGREVSIKCE